MIRHRHNSIMKNPEKKEKNEQEVTANRDVADTKVKESKETNWHPHQQIDEEGNEIGPEDIK